MKDIFLSLPAWALFIIIVGGLVGLSLGVALQMRHLKRDSATNHQNEVTSFFFAAVSVLYAVVLGFLVISAWDEFNAADHAVSAEAAAVISVTRYSTILPEPQRSEVRTLLYHYTESVTNNEWNLMRMGLGEELETQPASADISALWSIYGQLSPNAVTAAAIQSLDNLSKQRVLRISSSTGGLPGIFWVVLVLGAVVTIAYGLMLQVENQWHHIWMIGLLAFLIGTCLWLIFIMNNPFDGDLQVSSRAFDHVISILHTLAR